MNIEEKLALITENTWIISDTHFGHRSICGFEHCRLTAMRIDGYDDLDHDQWIIDNWNAVVKPEDVVLCLGDFAFKNGYYTKAFNEVYEQFKNTDQKTLKNRLKILNRDDVPRTLNDFMKLKIPQDSKIEKEVFKSIIGNYIPEKELFIRYEDVLNGTIILIIGNHDPKPKQFLNRNVEVIDGFYWSKEGILNKVYNPDPMFSGFIKEFNNKKYLFCHYPVFDSDEWDKANKMIAPRIKLLDNIYSINECDYNIHGHTHSNKSTFDRSINVSFEHLNFRPQRLKDFIK